VVDCSLAIPFASDPCREEEVESRCETLYPLSAGLSSVRVSEATWTVASGAPNTCAPCVYLAA